MAREKLIQPLPWRVGPHRGFMGQFGVFDCNDVVVFGNVTEDEATLIVTAVNAHEELLAALKLYVDHFGDPLKVARSAIARAEDMERFARHES